LLLNDLIEQRLVRVQAGARPQAAGPSEA